METINRSSTEDISWQQTVLKYATPDLTKSLWQIVNSVIPYLAMWFIMYKSLEYPYWVTLLLSVPAAGFLIRIFIIFHDCGHRSFFKSAWANRVAGAIMGIMVFTPFEKWHYQHKVHHATSGNLDKRGIGDVWTMTVDEYHYASRWKRFLYRSFRNPYLMFTVGPVFIIFITNRFSNKKMSRDQKIDIYFTNIIIALMIFLISMVIGLKAFLLVQLPIVLLSHSIGVWLFYIQHTFEDVVWERTGRWDYKKSALEGSSFLKLPRIFQWFTGNIGFHHVHHLSSKIPNYNLEKCHNENEMFKEVRPIILLSTFKALHLSLWDEANRQMVRFRELAVKPSQFSKDNLEVQKI